MFCAAPMDLLGGSVGMTVAPSLLGIYNSEDQLDQVVYTSVSAVKLIVWKILSQFCVNSYLSDVVGKMRLITNRFYKASDTQMLKTSVLSLTVSGKCVMCSDFLVIPLPCQTGRRRYIVLILSICLSVTKLTNTGRAVGLLSLPGGSTMQCSKRQDLHYCSVIWYRMLFNPPPPRFFRYASCWHTC